MSGKWTICRAKHRSLKRQATLFSEQTKRSRGAMKNPVAQARNLFYRYREAFARFDAFSASPITAKDVAAAARTLPPEERALLGLP